MTDTPRTPVVNEDGSINVRGVDLSVVDGSAAATGHGTAAGAFRVELPTDGTGQVKTTNWPATVDTNSGNKSASTPRVVLATDQPNLTTPLNVNVAAANGREYETVAASQTAQVLGATGGTGDDIDGLLVIPATVDAGQVLLLDGATSITVFTGGTGSVSNLIPFFIPLGLRSISGAWKITTGAAVSVIGIGNFT